MAARISTVLHSYPPPPPGEKKRRGEINIRRNPARENHAALLSDTWSKSLG